MSIATLPRFAAGRSNPLATPDHPFVGVETRFGTVTGFALYLEYLEIVYA
jgi:hypothetical protein